MKNNRPFVPIVLFFLDFMIVFASFVVAYLLRDELNGVQLIDFSQFVVFALLTAVLYSLIFIYFQLYSTSNKMDLLEQLFHIVIGGVTATTLAGAGIYFGKQFDYSRLIIGFGMIISILLVGGLRVLVRLVEGYLYSTGHYMTRVVLVGGGGETTSMAINGYKARKRDGYELVGIILMYDSGVYEVDELPVLGDISEIDFFEIIKLYGIDELVLTDSISNEDQLTIINACEETGVEFKFVPDMYNSATSRVVTEDLAGMPLITLKPTALEGWMVVMKRVIDLVGALLGIILLSPILVATACAVRLDSAGPILFVHKRVGRFGKEFGLIKFRSMAMLEKDGELLHSQENKEVEEIKEQQENYKLEHDPRITRVGRFIRKTSIDELPQLLNVLRGEISLTGPRAYVKKELDSQQERYPETKALVRRLLTVKPGVTGLWQISGRSNVSFTERVAMDAYYATHANIWMDIKIILLTVPTVLKGSGAM